MDRVVKGIRQTDTERVADMDSVVKGIRQTDTERVAEMDSEVKGIGHRMINRETVIEMKEGRDRDEEGQRRRRAEMNGD